MCHTELHLHSEGPSLTVTGITLLLCVQYPFGGFFFPHGRSYTRGQVSMVLYWFLLHCDVGKGWISCSKRYRKLRAFCCLVFESSDSKTSCSAGLPLSLPWERRRWDIVAWRGVSHAHRARCGHIRVVKCCASGLPLEMEMGKGGKNKDQCLWLVHIIDFSLGIWMTFLC